MDYLFKIVDKANKGYVSKADLDRVLGDKDEVLMAKVLVQPDDIFLPLGQVIKHRL